MEEIASQLIENGMDFQYESRGSDGEKITCFPMGLDISFQEGKIYYNYCADRYVLEDNEESRGKGLNYLDNAIIEETT